MPNTDIKINYYLRPQKSIERKMFCHLFRELNSIFCIKDYEYIGMGAKYFADFMLFHREFGFPKMVSIEADKENTEKYEFNKPLKCIQMEYGCSSEALHQIDWLEFDKKIIWLDYDDQLRSFMLKDISTIIPKLQSGSMFFFTYNANLYGSAAERLKSFKERLGDFCPPTISMKNITGLNKNAYMKMIINNVICNRINTINGSKSENEAIFYEQLSYFVYSDGAEMITVGGIILNKEDKIRFDALNLSASLDFVVQDINAPPYSLVVPPLTYKEVACLMEQLPCSDISQIKLPGLEDKQLNQISKLYRYYPFFLEAVSFN